MRVKVTDEANHAALLAAEKMGERVNEINIFLALLQDANVSQFWTLLCADMDIRIENLTSYRDSNFKTMTESDLKVNVGQEAAFRIVKNIPAGAERVKTEITNKRNDILKRINERTTRNKD